MYEEEYTKDNGEEKGKRHWLNRRIERKGDKTEE